MSKPRIGIVDSVSSFASGDGQRLVSIDGKQYAVSVNLSRFPIVSGSQVEYVTHGNRADILAFQDELLPHPQASNLFALGGE